MTSLQPSLEPTTDPAFRSDVLLGLAAAQKAIPARWFYDRIGSELFEAITHLVEYYPTRVETALLSDRCSEIATLVGQKRVVVEFGSGSSTKTPLLLRALKPAAYVPVDISGEFLRSSAAALSDVFRALQVLPLECNFSEPITLPVEVAGLARLGFFPGSTIGNMIARTAVDVLRNFRDCLGIESLLLIGMDRIKAPADLIAAYDDASNVTARFNLNLLTRINRELCGTVPLEAFVHDARWNDSYARVEMHLVATRDVVFTVEGQPFALVAGESIHTENSHKYGARDARLLLRAGGWSPIAEWTDADDSFALILAEARPHKSAP